MILIIKHIDIEGPGTLGDFLKAGVPYLGICLGSQLLAKAAGARVVKSPVKEIGWYRIQKCRLADSDRLFDGFREEIPVFQWHGDMFQIPPRGTLLASARGCPHQALRVGSNAYGLQFHIEVTDKSIKEWCDEYCASDLPGRLDHAKSMIEDYWKYKKDFDRQAEQLYHNFLNIINDCHSRMLLSGIQTRMTGPPTETFGGDK